MKNSALVVIDLQNDITKNYREIIGRCAVSTCCRQVPHDLTGQPQCGLHLLEPVKSPIVRSRFRLRAFVRAIAAMRWCGL